MHHVFAATARFEPGCSALLGIAPPMPDDGDRWSVSHSAKRWLPTIRIPRGSSSGLSGEQRETLELVFFHDLSEAEVAQVTGVAPGTVKSRLYRAKAALRRLLGAQEADHAP